MKRLICVVITVVLTALICGTAVSLQGVHDPGESRSSASVQEALSVWQGYVRSLREGDREKARGYWSEKAVRDSIFDWQMPRFESAVDLARADSLRVVDVKDSTDYVRLLVKSPGTEQTYYAIKSNGKAALANPIEALTIGWEQENTAYTVCHYAVGDAPTADQLNALENFCSELVSNLRIPLKRKIEYYKCGSAKEVGQLFASGPAAGRHNEKVAVAAATRWTSYHELTHIILGQTCRRRPTSLLLEGTACYFGGVSAVTREAQLAWAKTLVENGEAAPITAIARSEGFWAFDDMNDPYAQAASFVGFLITTYGLDEFKSLYKYRDGQGSLEAAIAGTCGTDLADLDEEWRKWIHGLKVPMIRLDASATAVEIFRMEDPANDDYGNGRYTYPLAPGYEPGMFDLTGFRVSAEKERMYFELKYRNLIEWEENSPWGFNGTFTRIAIDTGGQTDDLFSWDARATVAGQCDYLIDVSDGGVFVMHEGRVASMLLRKPSGRKLGDATADRIRFSIPCDETPQRDWRYVVATGGCTGRSGHLRDGVGRFLVVGKSPSDSTGGGGGDRGANPNLYDVLLPAGADQRKILSDYDEGTQRLVVLPMVGQ